MVAEGNLRVEVYTYTDSIGSDKYNLKLSEKRAEAMRILLIESGVAESDIKTIGRGESNPIADNESKAGQAINRRGEFVFITRTEAE